MDFTGFFEKLGRPVVFHPALAKLLGSKNAAILLEQLMYWTPRTKDPEGWVYKKPEEWEEETGLTYEEQLLARKVLKSKGVLQENHARLAHRLFFRINREATSALWDGGEGRGAVGQTPTGQLGKALVAGKGKPNSVLPEITAEIKTLCEHTALTVNGSPGPASNGHSTPRVRRGGAPTDFHPTPTLLESDRETHRIRYILTRFDLAFLDKVGDRHPAFTGKEAKLADRMLKSFGVDKAARMVDLFFQLDDQWTRDSGYGFAIFSSSTQIAKLLVKLSSKVRSSDPYAKFPGA